MVPLMPKATAIWLINNTALTFEQIADFCQIHILEIQGIADGEVAVGIVEEDPIMNGQLTQNEVSRCEKDPAARLKLYNNLSAHLNKIKKNVKYTPIARRQDKPNAILWFLKSHPYVKDAQIIKIVGTTRSTIEAIRSREHWNMANIRPKDPVLLGLCSQATLNTIINSAQEEAEKESKNK
jgi:hypothetical protein